MAHRAVDLERNVADDRVSALAAVARIRSRGTGGVRIASRTASAVRLARNLALHASRASPRSARARRGVAFFASSTRSAASRGNRFEALAGNGRIAAFTSGSFGSAAITTIVSSGMVRAVCEHWGIRYEETFTGFKFMAEKLAEYDRDGSYSYLLAFEESYGYMMGDYVRDKDAVTASMLIAEMAAHWYAQGKTLLDAMDELYEKYGFYAEETLNLYMYGVDGVREMDALMEKLRSEPPKEMNGLRVESVSDYLRGQITALADGNTVPTHIVGSNVLSFALSGGSRLVVRPSGTEPKLKVYLTVCADRPAESRRLCEQLKEHFDLWAR